MATQPAPPLATVAPSVPKDVAAIADLALVFERDARYPDARTMQGDVRAVRQGFAPPHVSALRAQRENATRIDVAAPQRTPTVRAEAPAVPPRTPTVPAVAAPQRTPTVRAEAPVPQRPPTVQAAPPPGAATNSTVARPAPTASVAGVSVTTGPSAGASAVAAVSANGPAPSSAASPQLARAVLLFVAIGALVFLVAVGFAASRLLSPTAPADEPLTEASEELASEEPPGIRLQSRSPSEAANASGKRRREEQKRLEERAREEQKAAEERQREQHKRAAEKEREWKKKLDERRREGRKHEH
jgi:hypothetical protein